MDLKTYVLILAQKWWLFLPTVAITCIAVVALTLSQTPVYQAKATFVVRLDSSFVDDKDYVSGLDILSRRAEIATTYAEVAKSRVIKEQAVERLGLSPEQRRNLSVDSRLIAGTNILEITVEGNDPAVVADFTNAIGAETVAYVHQLYEKYVLEPLDEARQPRSPIKPNGVLNVTIGWLLALVLGASLVFLTEYLRAPLANAATYSIVDNGTGAYNKRYFVLRLQQEMSRARRNGDPLSIALINVNHRGVLNEVPAYIRDEALRKMAAFFEMNLRDEDLMARVDDTTFAFLLPDMPGERAQEMVEGWRTSMSSTPLRLEGRGLEMHAHFAAGVTAYLGNSTEKDELLAQARRALEDAETATYGKVCLFASSKTTVAYGQR